MKFAIVLTIAVLFSLGACSPGGESGLTRAEQAKYEAWIAELERQESTRVEMETNVTAAEAELEQLAEEFLKYEAELNQLLDQKSTMPEDTFDAELANLRENRAKLVAKREALEAARERPEAMIRAANSDVAYGTPFMQAASELNNDRLLFALLSATGTEGPVKRHIDADLDLKAHFAEVIASHRTSTPEDFRESVLESLEDLDREIDDNQALILILKTP
jgi:chromosome segregation ATPase